MVTCRNIPTSKLVQEDLYFHTRNNFVSKFCVKDKLYMVKGGSEANKVDVRGVLEMVIPPSAKLGTYQQFLSTRCAD